MIVEGSKFEDSKFRVLTTCEKKPDDSLNHPAFSCSMLHSLQPLRFELFLKHQAEYT